MSLYGWVMLLSFLGPFCLSFDKKVAFFKQWKHLLLPLLFVATPFLIWDQFFTEMKIWGFTKRYIFEVYLGKLPLEECLFFLVVPFNCIFIYEVLANYFKIETKRGLNMGFLAGFSLVGLLLIAGNLGAWYTITAVSFALVLTSVLWFWRPEWLTHFILTYLVCLLPFLLVNGALTGAFTPEPVVWYQPSGFSGIRIITIPIEDLFYNFDLLLGTLIFYQLSQKRLLRQK